MRNEFARLNFVRLIENNASEIDEKIEQTREDEELNVHSIESEIYRRIQESENEKEEICYD